MNKMPVIEIKDVSKSFKEIEAVKNLTLTIYEGEYVALLGPNGAGKTTLIEMIEGLQKPDAGTIRILGMNWREHEQKLHQKIGLSLQETKFIDKVTTGLDPGARREVWKILEKLRRDFKTTMILTTHYMEEAEVLCERILIMDKGEFIAAGTLPELNARYGEGDLIEITFD